jgi:hypothetical protein
MYSNVLGTVQSYCAERHGAVPVSDDHDPAGRCGLDGTAGARQDEPVGGVDGYEVVGLDVGEALQNMKVEGVAHRGHP